MSLVIHRAGSADAPAVVFLHGAGVSSWMWEAQMAALRGTYYCLAVDLPANGDSYQTEWVSFADTADQVAAIIRREIPAGKAHVVGLSLGGFTGLSLLHRHGAVVQSLIVSGVSAKPFTHIGWWRVYLKVMTRLMKWEGFLRVQAKAMHIPPAETELYIRDNQRTPMRAFARIQNEVLAFTLPDLSAQPDTRVLAVAGELENAMFKESLTVFAKQRANTTAALIPKAHHPWNAEYPDLFTTMIRAWVSHAPLPPEIRLIAAE